MDLTSRLTCVRLLILAMTAISNSFGQSETVVPPTDAELKKLMEESGGLWGDDMKVSEQMTNSMQLRSGQLANYWRWPNGQLFVYYDPGFSAADRKILKEGIAKIESKTCIRIFPWTGQSPNYVNVTRNQNDGCWSYVGKVGGMQELNLGAGCVNSRIFAHEMIHAIGFFHEHSRPDRDNYVRIILENIRPGQENAFRKYTTASVTTFGIPYDFNSIMHYGSHYFSRNSKPTIESIVRGSQVSSSQSEVLSGSDAAKINAMYQGICKIPKNDFRHLFNGADDLRRIMETNPGDRSVYTKITIQSHSPRLMGCGLFFGISAPKTWKYIWFPDGGEVKCGTDNQIYRLRLTKPSSTYLTKLGITEHASKVEFNEDGYGDTRLSLACIGFNVDTLPNGPRAFCVDQKLFKMCREIPRLSSYYIRTNVTDDLTLTRSNRGYSQIWFESLPSLIDSFDKLRQDPDDAIALDTMCGSMRTFRDVGNLDRRDCITYHKKCTSYCTFEYLSEGQDPNQCRV